MADTGQLYSHDLLRPPPAPRQSQSAFGSSLSSISCSRCCFQQLQKLRRRPSMLQSAILDVTMRSIASMCARLLDSVASCGVNKRHFFRHAVDITRNSMLMTRTARNGSALSQKSGHKMTLQFLPDCVEFRTGCTRSSTFCPLKQTQRTFLLASSNSRELKIKSGKK